MRESPDQDPGAVAGAPPPGRGGPAPTASLPTCDIDALRSELEGLRTALRSRPVIDIARGILIASTPCTSEQAWQILVDASQDGNIKLREIARQLVESFHGTPVPPATRRALETAIRRARTR
ncbi:ANTAR domain-containing protein [Streptomyces griseus]|uniref:ANTAR domain-containing protein n=1 Tax=Streptomyces sp. CMC78 TaxID=3231512 RepID=A0AB33KZ89_9ACTN|nr:ANTAR domain-containing protein [Streptomyces sp. ID01-9D]MDX5571526.1 ANTAR domain-containing protein [Streptomyces sp. ID01-9D]WSV19299.1 ANTAR domain-containing protein [Streptomyces fimicarius]